MNHFMPMVCSFDIMIWSGLRGPLKYTGKTKETWSLWLNTHRRIIGCFFPSRKPKRNDLSDLVAWNHFYVKFVFTKVDYSKHEFDISNSRCHARIQIYEFHIKMDFKPQNRLIGTFYSMHHSASVPYRFPGIEHPNLWAWYKGLLGNSLIETNLQNLWWFPIELSSKCEYRLELCASFDVITQFWDTFSIFLRRINTVFTYSETKNQITWFAKTSIINVNPKWLRILVDVGLLSEDESIFDDRIFWNYGQFQL